MLVQEEDLSQFARGNFSNALIHGYLQRDIAEALLLSKYNTGKNGTINEIASRAYSTFNITVESLQEEQKRKNLPIKTKISTRERIENYFLHKTLDRLQKSRTLKTMVEKTQS